MLVPIKRILFKNKAPPLNVCFPHKINHHRQNLYNKLIILHIIYIVEVCRLYEGNIIRFIKQNKTTCLFVLIKYNIIINSCTQT